MPALIGFTGPPDHGLVRNMAGTLRHRGDLCGDPLAGDAATIALLSSSQTESVGIATPRTIVDGDLQLVFSGYLTAVTCSTARVAASPDRSETKCSPLMEFLTDYRDRGPAAIDELEGAFALAILDGDRLQVARDAAGVFTAYYGRVGDRWFIATEPKAITTAPGFSPRVRPAVIAQYLSFSFVPDHGTMLEDLFEVPAGHCVTLRSGSQPKRTRYFCFETEEHQPDVDDQRPESHWISATRRTIEQAVAERLPRGEPVGVFLSGGLDSSIVTAEVARQHRHKVRTYAIHFGPRYPHELDFARSVAERCRTEHHEILIRPRDFLPRLRKMIWHLDDPIGDPITQPNFELAARVAGDSPWVFNGEGGDPLFGGPKNLPMMLQHWYGGLPRESNFREQAYLASYRRAYDELKHLLSPELQAAIDWEAELESTLAPYFQTDQPRSFLNKLMVINIRLKGAHLILPKVERMLAAWGVTPLAPLFDERLIRLSFEMPPKMKLAGGIEKLALKRAYADDLPRPVIERPKSGMRVPVHYWFQGDLRRYARKILHPRRVREVGWFNADRVAQLLRYDREEGSGRFGMRLWMLITLEIWRRIVVERETP
jgi:asparagine synthase (glutamine-hydrolysing)